MQSQESSNTPAGSLVVSDKILPDDPRYKYSSNKKFNLRFSGKPDYIRLVQSIDELMFALQEAVTENQRVVIRCGGHCLENFVDDIAVKVVIDISMMKGVRFDTEMGAFEIIAGTTVGEMYEKLYNEWGVVVPAGEHPAIGMGGHIAGGAFGFLCRQFGLAVDYLYAVEMLWVDDRRKVQKVIATRESEDLHRDLWWAHTGGGAGNFGVVTRYWFRSVGTFGDVSTPLLPLAPPVIETFEVEWKWEDFNEHHFTGLVRNFGNWCENNSGADDAGTGLFATLHLWRRQYGKLQIKGLITTGKEHDTLLDSFMQAISHGLDMPHQLVRTKMSWLDFALKPFPDIFTDGKAAFKVKDALMRKQFTDRQIKVIFNYLESTEYDVPGGFIGHATYGGTLNAITPEATASVHRDSIMTTACAVGWGDPKEEAKNLDWVRSCYKDLFAETGGVPVPNVATSGTLINHPDADLADPAFNTSGVPWYTMYYQSNYARLQQVKAKWDPCNIFHHLLSVQV
ncbi:MAG: FAD-binding protein [Chitinophagaceae bacterium]